MEILSLSAMHPVNAPSASVVALGFFDGVHRAHVAVLETAAREARRRGLPLLVFTFAAADAPKDGALLSTDAERAALFRAAGAEYCVFCDFSSVVSLSPEEFVREYLIGLCHTAVAVSGEDFRFGYRAAGDSRLLAELMAAAGGTAVALPPVLLGGAPISSTRIRRALEEGDCETAAELLGRPYSVTYPVLHGDGLGHGLGFPTANQVPPPSRMLPARGVYRTAVTLEDGSSYIGVTNVGVRPTVEGEQMRIETHLLHFSGELYGRRMTVAFLAGLRGEKKFSSLRELSEQIEKDCEEVRTWMLQNGLR